AAFGQAPESCTSNILYSADVPGTSEDPALCFASQARCETPIDDGRFLRKKDPACDPEAGPCTVQLGARLRFPGNALNLQQNLGTGKVYWYESATAPGCNPSRPPFPSCGQLGICGNGVISQSLFNFDRAETWIELSASCASAPGEDRVFSFDAWICMTSGSCNRRLAVDGLAYGGASLAAALACDAPKKRSCPSDNPCFNCRGHGEGGAGVGGGGGGAAPSGSGPGRGLRQASGGVGGPSDPGSASLGAAGSVLGRYWMHPWAERIVEDPNDSHVWLVTRHATFREYSNLTAGVYETVSPSDDYRTLRRTASGWELEDLEGMVQSFDSSGAWTGTVDRWGNATTPTYAAGDLTDVSFPDGRRLTFTYSGGKLATITEWGVLDAASRTWTYTWTGEDLSRIDRPDGTAWALRYDDGRHPGYLTRMTLVGTGGETRIRGAWEYDAEGNATHFWEGTIDKDDPAVVGRWQLAFDNDTLPSETTLTDPLGNPETVVLGRDSASLKPKILRSTGVCPSCSLGPESVLEYGDSDHPLLPTARVDAKGHRTEWTYTDHGRIETLTEAVDDPALTRTTARLYHPTYPALVTRIDRPSVDGLGMRTTVFDYDSVGNLEFRTESGHEATFGIGSPTEGSFSLVTGYPSYNSAGRVETIDPPGYGTSDQTSFTYDSDRGGLLIETRQDPLLVSSTVFTWTPFNRQGTTTDPNGVLTERQYDALDRLRFVIQRAAGSLPGTPFGPDDLVTENLYNPFGDLETPILPRGNRIVYSYDLAGRLEAIERQDAAGTPGERVLYTLDGAGNREGEEHQRWDGAAWVTEKEVAYDFESRCRMRSMTLAPGISGQEATTTYGYDCNGNLESTWDARRDPLVDPPSQTNLYDALDRLAQIRQPWGGVGGGEVLTDYEYDVQDHLTAVIDGEGNQTDYTYSDRDLMTREDSPVSGTTLHLYNDHGELVSKTDARGVETVRTVDALDRVTRVQYLVPDPIESPSDDPEFLVDPSPSTDYLYDLAASPCGATETSAMGRLSSILRHGESVDYCYDRFGRVTRDGELTYGHDANGNRETIGYPGGVIA
ncbi:MAG: hypothetical protein AAF657_36400, partial [Acidobacteriota bacterium]